MVYDFDGHKYERASAHQKEWGAKLISGLMLKGDERVLDLGCGDGALTAEMADLLPHGEVLGIDTSSGMLDTAKSRERANLRFYLLDINEIDFKDEFDVIVSNATLHWIKDHVKLLSNVYRALREGGLARFNFAGHGNCSNFFRVVREAMEQEIFRCYFDDFVWPWYMPDVGEYLIHARESNLREVKVWGENADRFFPNTEALIGWIDQPSLVPFLSRVAEKDKEIFRKYVIGRMIAETGQDDGRFFETFRRINLFAKK